MNKLITISFIVITIISLVFIVKMRAPDNTESVYEFYNMNKHMHEQCPQQRTMCVGCNHNGNGACAFSEVIKGVKYITQTHNNDIYKEHYGLSDIEYDKYNEKYCNFCDNVQGYTYKKRCNTECKQLINTKI